MSVVEIILGALLLIASIVLIIIIILQEGNQQGIGVVSGGADTFFSKNKARSYDAFLARATKWFAVGFVVIVLALNVITYFTSKNVTEEATDGTSVSETADATEAVAETTAAKDDAAKDSKSESKADDAKAADTTKAAEATKAAE